MNYHLRILQQWRQTVAIGACNIAERTVGTRRGQRLERADNKIIQGQKKICTPAITTPT